MIVRWEASALAELADAWLKGDSGDRRLIVEAAAEIDRQLLKSPETAGESRSDDERISFVSPIGVLFRVETEFVSVIHVWKIRKRR